MVTNTNKSKVSSVMKEMFPSFKSHFVRVTIFSLLCITITVPLGIFDHSEKFCNSLLSLTLGQARLCRIRFLHFSWGIICKCKKEYSRRFQLHVLKSYPNPFLSLGLHNCLEFSPTTPPFSLDSLDSVNCLLDSVSNANVLSAFCNVHISLTFR